MKQLKQAIIVVFLIGGTVSCGPPQPYQYIQSPTGQNMVVVHDGGNDFLMEAAMFTMLMNQGGYNNVITHYHHFPAQYGTPYNPSSYRGWRNMPSSWRPSAGTTNTPPIASPRDNGFRSTPSTQRPTFVNTTPPIQRTSGFRSTGSSFSRPTFKTTTPSSTRTSSFRRR